jgi:hypothetical protein
MLSTPVVEVQKAAAAPSGHGRSAAAQTARPPLQLLQRSIGNRAVLRLQRTCSACASGHPCGTCAGEKHAAPDSAASAPAVPAIVHDVIHSPGVPLDARTRAFMEPRFGRDFSRVQVHADTRAAAAARAVHAEAFTVGSEVVFGAQRYDPGSPAGLQLLAHELAHTVQQDGRRPGRSDALVVSPASDPAEREADAAAKAVGSATGEALTLSRSLPAIARQGVTDGGVDAGAVDAGAVDGGPVGTSPDGGVTAPPPVAIAPVPRICGPDISSAMTTMLAGVDSYFHGLGSWFRKRRSCMVLDIDSIVSGVSPIMAWDTEELYLPNTGILDPYFLAGGCGSPRDAGCETDPTRHLCETAGTCGNSVVVGGKCLLAGTANYAVYGRMFKLCHDEFGPDYPRWDMRAMIRLYKSLGSDDPEPPLAVASAAFDGTFPTLPAAAENRGGCTGRCGVPFTGAFDFVWEPYKPR